MVGTVDMHEVSTAFQINLESLRGMAKQEIQGQMQGLAMGKQSLP